MRLPIYPVQAFTAEHDEHLRSLPEDDPFPFPHYENWGPRAKWLLSCVLNLLDLDRLDEIAILTTTDWTYVSTCLSVTAFNFSRISRVVTDATKAVIVVHEFGYVYPEIAEKVEEWRSKGIVVIEDCAHLVGLALSNGHVGSFGDFTLVSLSKILPTPTGGLLLSRSPVTIPALVGVDEEGCAVGRRAAERYLGRHHYLSSERLRRHQILKRALVDRVWEPTRRAVPFATFVRRPSPDRSVEEIQFFSTFSESYRLVPTNPFVDTAVFEDIGERM